MMTDEQKKALYDACKGYLTGCPDVVINTTIDMSTIRYIEDTRNLTYHCGPIPVVPNVTSYQIDAPFGGRVLKVRDVINDFGRMQKYEWTIHDCGYGKNIVFRGRPCCKTFTAIVEWVPTEDTDELPEDYFIQNKSAIVYLTLATLLSQLTKPWGDEALGAQFSGMYNKVFTTKRYETLAEGDPGGRLSCFNSEATLGGLVL